MVTGPTGARISTFQCDSMVDDPVSHISRWSSGMRFISLTQIPLAEHIGGDYVYVSEVMTTSKAFQYLLHYHGENLHVTEGCYFSRRALRAGRLRHALLHST